MLLFTQIIFKQLTSVFNLKKLKLGRAWKYYSDRVVRVLFSWSDRLRSWFPLPQPPRRVTREKSPNTTSVVSILMSCLHTAAAKLIWIGLISSYMHIIWSTHRPGGNTTTRGGTHRRWWHPPPVVAPSAADRLVSVIGLLRERKWEAVWVVYYQSLLWWEGSTHRGTVPVLLSPAMSKGSVKDPVKANRYRRRGRDLT